MTASTAETAIPTSRCRPRDVVHEAATALTARPARTLMTALGTVIGVAALVATLGLATTAGNRIVTRFDELEATQVRVTPAPRSGPGGVTAVAAVIPWDAGDRLERLNGVTAAGTISTVDVAQGVRSVPVVDPQGTTEVALPVVAASPGTFDATRATIATGRTFDAGHVERGDPVVVLGPGAAQRLNVTRVDDVPAIFIGDTALAVIGILDDAARHPQLLNAAIIPDTLARDRFGLTGPDEVLVETQLGAAALVAAQAPTALAPDRPEQLRVAAPASPERVRSGVADDVNSLLLVLGGVSLLVGAIGIANVTLVSVLERTGEIGLRRALGATRVHVAIQFLTESVALGAIAGLVGTSLGVLTVVGVAASRQWTPVLQPWLPLVAPAVGAVIGLIAGTYPAWKASATEPIAALRAGT